MCKYCNVELLSDEYIATHLSGRKHKQALQQKKNPTTPREDSSSNLADDDDATTDAADDAATQVTSEGDGGENECVLTIPLEPNLPYLAISSPAKIEAIVEAERAQKKKAKKTKLLITQLALSYPIVFFSLSLRD